jgi:hypothetical protein
MRVHFMSGLSKTNHHIYPGFETVHGPKISLVKLTCHTPSTGHRLIFYFPSGAWWWFDVYFDRRPQEHFRKDLA